MWTDKICFAPVGGLVSFISLLHRGAGNFGPSTETSFIVPSKAPIGSLRSRWQTYSSRSDWGASPTLLRRSSILRQVGRGLNRPFLKGYIKTDPANQLVKVMFTWPKYGLKPAVPEWYNFDAYPNDLTPKVSNLNLQPLRRRIPPRPNPEDQKSGTLPGISLASLCYHDQSHPRAVMG